MEQELRQLTGASDAEPGGMSKLMVMLLGKQHRKPFFILFALFALYPLTGMYNIAFFAIDLFEKLGIGNEQAVAVSSALARALDYSTSVAFAAISRSSSALIISWIGSRALGQ